MCRNPRVSTALPGAGEAARQALQDRRSNFWYLHVTDQPAPKGKSVESADAAS
jgi:hypothetical protein